MRGRPGDPDLVGGRHGRATPEPRRPQNGAVIPYAPAGERRGVRVRPMYNSPFTFLAAVRP